MPIQAAKPYNEKLSTQVVPSIKDLQTKYYKKLDPLDVDILIAHVLEKPREFVLAHPEHSLKEREYKKLKKLLGRRAAREPAAYITGHKEFYGLDFKVIKHTLIPRPETELLVETALTYIRTYIRRHVQYTKYNAADTVLVDVGTGCGNIIISIAKNILAAQLSRIRFFATDISPAALRIAKQNAAHHKLNKKIKLLRGDLFEPLIRNTGYKIPDTNLVVVANLPYLSPALYRRAAKDIRQYEPKSALISSKSGLDYYEKLFRQIKNFYEKNKEIKSAAVIIEFSPEQKTGINEIIKKTFLRAKIIFKKDLAKKFRAAAFFITRCN